MSGTMRAQFQLDLLDGMSGPIERIERVLGGLQQQLDRLTRLADPFAGLQEPVAAATRTVDALRESVQTVETASRSATSGIEALDGALDETAQAAQAATASLEEIAAVAEGLRAPAADIDALDAALGETAEAATEAGAALGRIGEQAEQGAARAVSGLERLRGTLGQVAASPGAGGANGGGGHRGGDGLMGAGRRFTDSVHHGVGSAFGAAAMGFGLIEPVHAAADYQNTLTHIGIGLGIEGAANATWAQQFGRQIDALARQDGQRGTDLAEAAGFFSREGYRADQLNAVLPVVSRISTAYTASPEAVAKSTFALQENLHVGPSALSGALASLALAGKSADLPFEQLAPLLPKVAAQAGMLGLTGRSGVDDLASALAVVRKSTGTEGAAVTDAERFLSDIISPNVNKRFNDFGVDLYKIEANARKTGGDPMMEVMRVVDRLSRHGDDRKVIGTLFGNQESQGFVQALLAHWDQYQEIHARTSGANQRVINEDYNTARNNSDLTALNAFEEALAQIERKVGHGFVPVLRLATTGLDAVLDAWDRMDQAFPQATPIILGVAGGTLALVTAVTALGAVAGPLAAGVALLGAGLGAVLSPIGLVVVGLGAAGVAAYELLTHTREVSAAMLHAGDAITGLIERIVAALPDMASRAWHATTRELSDIWHDPLGRHTAGTHTPIPVAAGAQVPLRIEVAHAPDLRVTVQPHPVARVQAQPAPGLGRTVGRP